MAKTLTPEELAVLRCLAQGLNDGECAGELGVSRSTVARRRRSAVEKLGALNETHAVALAIRRGLIV